MKIEPVLHIETPAYPLRDEFLADKQSLQECLPNRWRKSMGLAGALAILLAANLTGCSGTNSQPKKAAPPQANTVVDDAGYWIRSIFQEQDVMMGCVAIMPPAVLQEDAAVNDAGDPGPNS
jgi:hypothetical protein